MCDVPGLVRRYLRAASASIFRSSGRCGRGNRAATWESAEQGGEVVGDWIWRVLLCRNDLVGSGQCKSLVFAVAPLGPQAISILTRLSSNPRG